MCRCKYLYGFLPFNILATNWLGNIRKNPNLSLPPVMPDTVMRGAGLFSWPGLTWSRYTFLTTESSHPGLLSTCRVTAPLLFTWLDLILTDCTHVLVWIKTNKQSWKHGRNMGDPVSRRPRVNGRQAQKFLFYFLFCNVILLKGTASVD